MRVALVRTQPGQQLGRVAQWQSVCLLSTMSNVRSILLPQKKGQVAPMVEQWFEAPRVMVRFHCCPQNGEASVMATYGIVNAETRVQFSSSPKSVRQRWRAGMVCKTIALLNRFESYYAH